MAFPASPEVNDLHTEGAFEFIWDGKRWAINSGTPSEGGSTVPTVVDLGNAGTSKTIDITAGDIQKLTLNSSSCTISFTGTPAAGTADETILHIVKDNNTTARAVVWSGVEWPNDTAPFLATTTANAEAFISVITLPSGARRAMHAGNFFP